MSFAVSESFLMSFPVMLLSLICFPLILLAATAPPVNARKTAMQDTISAGEGSASVG